MKRSKLLLVLVLALLAVMALVACDKTPVHEHAYGGWTIETAPTASAEGTATRKCACGEKETATLASLSDTSVWTVSNNVPATHTQDGCTVYTSQYGTVVVTLGKLTDHKYGAWEITVKPDLTTAGKAKRTCECGDIDEVDVPALENASVWTAATVVRASHDEEGLVRYTSVYGTVEKIVAKGEHSWSSWKIVTAPTATEKGEAARFCTTDGCKSTETAELPVLTDTTAWTASVTAAATCTTPEITAYTSRYGTVTVETAPANGHSFQVSAIIAEPKCTEKGSATIKCTVCDCEETKEIAALGHEFSGAFVPYVVSAMESEDGETWGTDYDGSEYHAQKCSRCGEYDAAHKQAHTYEGAEVVFTSHENGGYHQVSATHACTVCGYNATFGEAWGNLEDWTKGDTVAATYTSAGYTEYTTEKDGVTYTYRLPIAKLVAPYDGKTYGVIEIDGATDTDEIPDRVINGYARSAHVTLDETGKGTGVGGYPFNGNVSVVMEDPATGKVKVISGNTNFTGYVDAETGIIVCARDTSFDFVFLLTPYEENTNADNVKASVFAGTLAIDYSVNCEIGAKHSFSIFSTDNGVYFGVRFNNGTADISANECFEAENLVVFDKDGNKIKGFKKVDGTTTALDGYEGTYTNSADATESVVIDGIGGLVINGTVNGVYTKAADADYFEVYVVDGSGVKIAYYHVTLSGDTYTKVAKTATIHYSSSEEGTVAPADETVSANVVITLATMSNTTTKIFKGWRRTGSEEIITTLTPVVDEVINLEAVWTSEVKISVKDAIGGDKELTAGAGDTLSSILPAYETEKTVSPDNTKYFVCWYIDANRNGAFDAGEAIEVETEISSADNGITVVANWADAYVMAGSYFGTEIWSESSGNSTKYTLTISVKGKITGEKNGEIVSYDAATGKVTWKTATSTTEYYFWYNAENEVLVMPYSNGTTIGTDYYIFTTALTEKSYKANAAYGVKHPSDQKYRLQFANINTINGAKDILVFDNAINTNIAITTSDGTALSVADIKNAKTLIVKDATTNEMIVSVAAKKASFASSETQVLDEYYGTYTCEGQDNLVLDGVGNFAWGSKNGTYTLKDATAKTFDAYVVADGKNTEYYVITLDTTAKTYTTVKPTVQISFETEHESVSAVDVNANVAYTLPTITTTGFVLRGWYVKGDADMKLVGATYVPAENVTLVAKWDEAIVITYNYLDGGAHENKVVTSYYANDKITLEKVDFKYGTLVFDGWYTKDGSTTDDWGTKMKDNDVITESATYYVKWIVPHAMMGTYSGYEIDGRLYTSQRTLTVDAYGKTTGLQRGEIFDFDAETGLFKIGTTSSYKYGHFDAVSKTIVVSFSSFNSSSTEISLKDDFYVLVEGESATFTSVCVWNKDKTALMGYGENKFFFVHNNKVYGDVTVTAKDSDGNAITDTSKYATASNLIIARNSEVIAQFGYDGTTLVELDGYQGKYTAADGGEVELDGVKTIKFGGNTGTYAKAADGAGYTFDVYMTEGENTVYYRVTVEKSTMAYTVVKPMVTITYNTNGVTPVETLVASESKNMNVPYALPVLTNADKVFRGWYVSTDESKTLVSENYVPTADVTLVAKWDDKVTLTIVYSETNEQTFAYGVGDTLNMNKYIPAYADGKAFDHWYTLDSEGKQVVFNSNVINESIRVYAAYVEAVSPFVGTFKGIYLSVPASSNDRKIGVYANQEITVTAQGVVTGDIKGTIRNYDPATNTFEIVDASNSSRVYPCTYDPSTGLFAVNDYNTTSSPRTIKVFVMNASSLKIETNYYGHANGLEMVAFSVKVTDASGSRKVNIFLNNGKVYGNVTVYINGSVATDVSQIGQSINYVETLVFEDQDGNIIVKYRKQGWSYVKE